MTIDILHLVVFPLGVIIGTLNALCGGGALITIPALMFLGMPPHVAVATNKFAVIGNWSMALRSFDKADKIDKAILPMLCAVSVLGCLIGTALLLTLPATAIKLVIGFIMLAMIPLLVFKQDLGLVEFTISRRRRFLGYGLAFLLAIYGGFVGAGYSLFNIFILCSVMGMSVIRAHATGILPWLCSLVLSVLIFVFEGSIDYSAGLLLMAGATLGGYIGARMSLRGGDQWVKRLFILIVMITAAKLLYSELV